MDGGIVGGPPRRPATTRLYLSGEEAPWVAGLFAGSVLAARVVPDASALKMTYAAWSKGTAAMLLAIGEVARFYGVEEALAAEWRDSQPELHDRLASAERSAARKGWRWIGEMEEIADTFAAAGQPEVHRAAAEVFRPDRARGLEKRYGAGASSPGVDVELEEGGFLVVTGRNGSGKTTLLRVLAAWRRPTAAS